jgi:transcription-repair coupling factor (superfamily II helicase)
MSGYGKTEVAIRAAFKVDRQRQTGGHPRSDHGPRRTALPHLHPAVCRVPVHGRCRQPVQASRSSRRRVLKRVASGAVDVVIGTHRLLSADVRFKDLGLVVIDEEQRFGVEHKERLKRLRATVHVLTMTATPDPPHSSRCAARESARSATWRPRRRSGNLSRPGSSAGTTTSSGTRSSGR